jgi:hypothetical protein
MQGCTAWVRFVWLVAALGVVGCGSTLKQQELERVAKDWAMTIRASQVIPVYPLTEDLQPGDVFLVTRPIQEQQREYARRGYLPLDQHMTRLNGINFASMYGESYGIGKTTNVPRQWQFPPAGLAPEAAIVLASLKSPVVDPNPGDDNDANATPKSEANRIPSTTLWRLAPRAGFPSYTFDVRSGSGATVAIPIQGVPVGLSLLQSDSATGTVTIADAYTYAIPFDQIVDKVQEWASRSENRRLLRQVDRGVRKGESWFQKVRRWIQDDPEPTVYLRVVHRVYLAERVVVQLLNDRAFSGKLTGGKEQEVDPPWIIDGKVTENFKETLKLKDIGAEVPGGTVKINYASHRSISMSETFDRPLVIGFLGFDFPVLDEGTLGAPIATLNQVEAGALAQPEALDLRGKYLFVKKRDKARDRELVSKLDQLATKTLNVGNLPALFACTAQTIQPTQQYPEAITHDRVFVELLDYLERLSESERVLSTASEQATAKLQSEKSVSNLLDETQKEKARIEQALKDPVVRELEAAE